MGVCIAVTRPFVLEGKASGSKDFITVECGIVVSDLKRTCYWGGEICVRNLEISDNCVHYGCGKRVMVCSLWIAFGECVVVSFV